MKVYLLILFSVFSIESALASLDVCKRIFPFLKKSAPESTSTSPSSELASTSLSSELASILTKEELNRKLKKILKTHKPKVAESIFREVLAIPDLHTSSKIKIIKTLEKITNSFGQNHLTKKTQLALANLFNSETTKPEVKDAIIDAFIYVDNPLTESLQIITERIKKDPVLFINQYIPDTYYSGKIMRIFKQIIEIYGPFKAETLLLEAFKKADSSYDQNSLQNLLAKIAGNKTQSELMKLFLRNEYPNHKFSIMLTFSRIKNPSKEVVQSISQILLEKDFSLSEKRYALNFFDNKNEESVIEVLKEFLLQLELIPNDHHYRYHIINDIFGERKPEVAQVIFREVFPKIQDKEFQLEIIEALLKVNKDLSQSELVELLIQNPQLSKTIFKKYIPEVAEAILIEALSKTPYENVQVELIKPLAKVVKRDSTIQIQSTLVKLYKSEKIEPDVKDAIIDIFKSVENPFIDVSKILEKQEADNSHSTTS